MGLELPAGSLWARECKNLGQQRAVRITAVGILRRFPLLSPSTAHLAPGGHDRLTYYDDALVIPRDPFSRMVSDCIPCNGT